MKKTLMIDGMSCNHCVLRVKNALMGVDGVTSAEVNLAEKKAVVEAADTVDAGLLEKAVTGAGYRVTGVS